MKPKKTESVSTDYIGSSRKFFTKILDKLGGELREKPEPLSQNAQIVYEILISLPPHKAMTLPQILDEVSRKHNKQWDEKELYNRVFPQLKKWGLKNKRRVGYWIERQE